MQYSGLSCGSHSLFPIQAKIFICSDCQEIAAIRQAYRKSESSIYIEFVLFWIVIYSIYSYPIALTFFSEYRKDLQEVIKDETSGDFETLLVELCKVCALKGKIDEPL